MNSDTTIPNAGRESYCIWRTKPASGHKPQRLNRIRAREQSAAVFTAEGQEALYSVSYHSQKAGQCQIEIRSADLAHVARVN